MRSRTNLTQYIYTKIQENKKWFRGILYAFLAILGVFAGLYAALYRISDEVSLNKLGQTALQGTQRTFEIKGAVSRRLFPRPTIIINDLSLSESDGKTPAATAKEVRIGMAWSSLFNHIQIEKLVINDVATILTLQNNSQNQEPNQSPKWNISDLLNVLGKNNHQPNQSDNSGNLVSFNRIQINRGKILLQNQHHQIELNDIFYNQENQAENIVYNLNANLSIYNHNWLNHFSFNAKGYAQTNQNNQNNHNLMGGFILPNLTVQFKGQENNHDFSGTWSSQARFNHQEWLAENNKISIKSNRFNAYSDITVDKIRQNFNLIQWDNVNSVFAGQVDYFNNNNNLMNVNGSLTLNHGQWDGKNLNNQELAISLLSLLNQNNQNNQKNNLNIHIDSDVNWNQENGLVLPNLKFTTRQEQASGLPRLVSEFSGQINVQDSENWKANIQGLLDRQPANILIYRDKNAVLNLSTPENVDNLDLENLDKELEKEQERNKNNQLILGEINFSKLNLTHYLDQIEHNAEQPYPNWLNQHNIKINLNINTLVLPSLEINEIKTVLNADNNQIKFEPLVANLYGGHTEGNFIIQNQTPLQFKLSQKANAVQIRPLLQDLFRNSSLSGKGQAELDFVTTGSTRQQLTENLSGNLNLNLESGDWHGINIHDLINNATDGAPNLQTKNNSNNQNNPNNLDDNGNNESFDDGHGQATPFESLIFKAKIKKGVSNHTIESRFINPVVTMTSKGQTILYTGQMNDDVMIYSNNKKNILPIRLSGTLDNPAISLNYEKITYGLKTAQQKKNAVEGALKKQWDWITEQNKNKNNNSNSNQNNPE